jgi:hypothetical protein
VYFGRAGIASAPATKWFTLEIPYPFSSAFIRGHCLFRSLLLLAVRRLRSALVLSHLLQLRNLILRHRDVR